MKLAQKFREIYDDTWTDSFEKLEEELKMPKQSAVQFLLEILQVT